MEIKYTNYTLNGYNMREQLISFDTAKLAKEKGFLKNPEGPYPTDEAYTKGGKLGDSIFNNYCIYAPTQSLLQKWIREKYDIHISIELTSGLRYCNCIKVFSEHPNNRLSTNFVNTYEEALEEGLKYALELIN